MAESIAKPHGVYSPAIGASRYPNHGDRRSGGGGRSPLRNSGTPSSHTNTNVPPTHFGSPDDPPRSTLEVAPAVWVRIDVDGNSGSVLASMLTLAPELQGGRKEEGSCLLNLRTRLVCVEISPETLCQPRWWGMQSRRATLAAWRPRLGCHRVWHMGPVHQCPQSSRTR